ncbi:alpha/beta hydrolase [Arenicella sp. 4NH20-0111]|uniref:alpha/beta fold hydrolase n=1 Tax=Arenicella sp. 4NH20-0111 TaxID=3127648 RepID=UPI00310AAB84
MPEKYLMANGLRFCYEEFGTDNSNVIVLIMGLGTQMISWPEDFCESLASNGFRVIRFDNRDIGLSQKVDTERETNLLKLLLRQKMGLKINAPYTLRDMACDTIGLLDFLEIDAAHWVGASMGGMIAQLLAAEYPDRTQSLTSIMSTSGKPNLPQTPLKVVRQMMTRPSIANRDAYLDHALKTWALIGSPAYPPSKEELTHKILRSVERSSYPTGYRNQVAAIMESGDRRGILRKIACPTLVIHGKADVLVPVEGGLDTAHNIRNAKLELIDGMGHDLPKELLPMFSKLIAKHACDAAKT